MYNKTIRLPVGTTYRKSATYSIFVFRFKSHGISVNPVYLMTSILFLKYTEVYKRETLEEYTGNFLLSILFIL